MLKNYKKNWRTITLCDGKQAQVTVHPIKAEVVSFFELPSSLQGDHKDWASDEDSFVVFWNSFVRKQECVPLENFSRIDNKDEGFFSGCFRKSKPAHGYSCDTFFSGLLLRFKGTEGEAWIKTYIL